MAHSVASLNKMSPNGKCFILFLQETLLQVAEFYLKDGDPIPASLPSRERNPTVKINSKIEQMIMKTLKLTIDPKIKRVILVVWMKLLSGISLPVP